MHSFSIFCFFKIIFSFIGVGCKIEEKALTESQFFFNKCAMKRFSQKESSYLEQLRTLVTTVSKTGSSTIFEVEAK